MAGAGDLQGEVRRTMLEAGGYWRPLAAVARLLEELGELLELLESPGPSGLQLAGELADLWIITTALADQFRIGVPDPAAGDGTDRTDHTASPAGGLVITAGQIARVVNFYDGPKTPRRAGELPSLTAVVGKFHAELELICRRLEIDLAAAVGDKLARTRAGSDMERFARETSDPSSAPILRALPPELAGLRLWGAPADPATPAAELAQAVAPSLTSFTKAAPAEGLVAYVLGAPAPAGTESLACWRAELVRELELLDPRGASGRGGTSSCEFSFNGMRLRTAIHAVDGAAASALGVRALLLLAPGGGSVLPGPGDDRP